MSGGRPLRLFVGNLPWTVAKKELREYFSNFGPVKVCSVVFNKKTGMSRGYGFVQFNSVEAYKAVISQNTHLLENSKLIIETELSRKSPQPEPGN